MFLLLAPNEKKLTLLYVVNDVLQEGRAKGFEFLKAFSPLLGSFFADFYQYLLT